MGESKTARDNNILTKTLIDISTINFERDSRMNFERKKNHLPFYEHYRILIKL